MKRAAIGVRMHSGWGALVAVGHEAEMVNVIQRRRVVVVPAAARGGKQPYHFAKSLEPEEAENFLRECFEASQSLALTAVRELRDELSGQYRVVGAAVLLASGRPLPSLAKILASHSLIHTAEGVFYREVFSKACECLELPVTGFRERDLDEHVQAPLLLTRIMNPISSPRSTSNESMRAGLVRILVAGRWVVAVLGALMILTAAILLHAN